MILIRGIKEKKYAKKIKQGVVDCRDILSALLCPPVTGYEYSDYYEKNLVKALTFFTGRNAEEFRNPEVLYGILINYYIPHLYLTYFHILNEHSLEWLDKFDDDYHFIMANAKIDRITQSVIGNEFFGTKMSYVDSIRQLDQDAPKGFQAACMCSLDNVAEDKINLAEPLRVYNTLAFPLLCREQDEKYTDIENEFRIIAYDCPRIRNGVMEQVTRNVTIKGKSGVEYKGVLEAGRDVVLKSSISLLSNPNKFLSTFLAEEQGEITLDSQFKSIDIREISDDYKYLGGKTNCAEYIKKTLECMPKEIYVDRTIIKEHKLSDVPDAIFLPGHTNVKY